MSREDALRALNESDWSSAEVEREPRAVSIVHSVRLPAELSGRVEAEAQRRRVTPSAVIRELIEVGLAAVGDDTTVTVRVSDLHRAIDRMVQRAA